jgi:hypothetical protein
MRILILAAWLASSAMAGTSAAAQAVSAPSETPIDESAQMWDAPSRLDAQREAMAKLAFMDGAWKGKVDTGTPAGALVQTERVGSLLDGTVKLVEGRGHDFTGKVMFNAFAVISYDPVKRRYTMRSYAMGYAGDFPLTVRADGFSWSHPAEPGATMRYTATIGNGQWHEIGERVEANKPPVKVLDMKLRRLGPSSWPQAGAVELR